MMDSLLHGFAENNIQENERKEDIKSMTLPELTTWMSALGEKGFRAKQLYNWMHKNLVSSFDEMTNLSGALKSKLKEQADFVVLTPVDVRISSIDGTRKYLFRLQDGNVIESVLMRYRKFRLHFHTSRLPYGLSFLCFYT